MKYHQRNRRALAALAVGMFGVSATLVGSSAQAQAAKEGQACAKKQANKTIGTLVCKKEGSKLVWRKVEVTATTAAAVAASGPAAPDLKGQEITFFHWRAEDKAVLEEMNKDFTAKTGVKVNMSILPSNDYQSTALQKILDGQPADVFTAFRGAQFFNMAKAGVFIDLSNQPFVKNYQANLIEPGKWENKQLGLPYQLVFNMPVYNVDLLKRLNLTPPTNINDLQRFCLALKEKGIAPIAWPGGEAANAGQLSMNGMVMNALPSDDAFAKIDTGAAKVTDFWMVNALQQFKDVAADCFQDNALGTKTDGAIALFAQEKAAMLATGTFHMGAALKLNPNLHFQLYVPITTKPGDKPKYEGIYNATFILGVSSKSKKQEAALAYVNYLSSPEGAAKYANGTSQHSTVAGVKYTTQELQDTSVWASKKTLLAPRFQFLNLDIRNAVEKAFVDVAGGKDAKQAAEEAQAVIDQKLGLK
jgi:raffinose/stachyose/melibiose transport system substrate-binding protein